MSAIGVNENRLDPNAERDRELDALSVYLREVEGRERMSRDEERQVADEIAACREDIVTTLRTLILEAAECLSLDATTRERLRTELEDPASEKKLEALQSRIATVASLARAAGEALRDKKRTRSAGARRLLAELARGFGVSPAVLERVAAEI